MQSNDLHVVTCDSDREYSAGEINLNNAETEHDSKNDSFKINRCCDTMYLVMVFPQIHNPIKIQYFLL